MAGRPLGSVRPHHVVLAMFLKIMLALVAVAAETRPRLRSDAHTVANFDSTFDVFADARSFTYDFVAYYDRVACRTPAAGEGMQI